MCAAAALITTRRNNPHTLASLSHLTPWCRVLRATLHVRCRRFVWMRMWTHPVVCWGVCLCPGLSMWRRVCVGNGEQARVPPFGLRTYQPFPRTDTSRASTLRVSLASTVVTGERKVRADPSDGAPSKRCETRRKNPARPFQAKNLLLLL